MNNISLTINKILIYIFAISIIFTFSGLSVAATEPVSIDLGTKGLEFGTTQQAAALQQLIQENPGSNRYQISYRTETDIVIFGCDISKDLIIRMHNTPDGHGTSETWSGDILYRISKAAAGGSLNDTHEGKRPGTFQRL